MLRRDSIINTLVSKLFSYENLYFFQIPPKNLNLITILNLFSALIFVKKFRYKTFVLPVCA